MMERSTFGKPASVPDPILPHSPSHSHHQRLIFSAADMGMKEDISSESDSGSSSGNVSDMIVDNDSKFAQISRDRVRINSNYSPPSSSQSSDQSESESKSSSSGESANSSSEEGEEEEEGLRPPRPRFPFLEDSDLSRSSTPSMVRPRTQPVATPLSNSAYGAGYGSCPPRRKAAQRVTYASSYHFNDDENEPSSEEDSIAPRRRRRKRSDSEFELSADSRLSSEDDDDSFLDDDDVSSEDNYAATHSRRGGTGRRGFRSKVGHMTNCRQCYLSVSGVGGGGGGG